MELLKIPNVNSRSLMMEHSLQVAMHLCHLKNYEGMFAVMTSLTSGPIFRLKGTFEGMSPTAKGVYANLKSYFADNFKRYRKELSDTLADPAKGGGGAVGAGVGGGGPILMYTACTLRDLTYIEELKNLKEEDRTFLNWKKMEMLYDIFRGISRVRESAYPFSEIPGISQYFLARVQESEDDLYRISKELEPPALTVTTPAQRSGDAAGEKEKGERRRER